MKACRIERTVARNGQGTLRATLENRSVYLHSSYDPEQEALSWSTEIDCRPGKVVVLFGLGLGWHLKALISELEQDQKIFVVEPCEEIRKIAQSTPETEALLRLSNVTISQDWSSFKEAFSRFNCPWQETLFLKIPAYQQVFPEEFNHFLSKLHHQVNSVLVDLCTVRTSSQKWLENSLRNLKYLPETTPIASVFNRFQGMPLIIVSAGPSLSKNIESLNRAKGRAFIVAVGTVNRLLARKGIIPDLLLSFDGGRGNYDHHFKGLPNSDVCLVFDPAVHHMVVQEHLGPKALMLINPANKWLEHYTGSEIGLLKIGPSISNTAFDLACRMGADPIILVGQDLAYTDDLTHAEGTHVKGLRGFDYKHREGDERSCQSKQTLRRFLWVEGVNGEKVRTDSKLLTFLHWFEERIEDLKTSRIVIDATEGGALIKGTLTLTLDETLDRYCQEDLSAPIQEIKLLLSENRDYDIDTVITYLRTVRTCTKRLASACKKGSRLSKLLKEHHTRGKECALPGTLERLNRIDQMLVREQKNYLPLHYLTVPILGFLSNRARQAENPTAGSHYSYLLYLELYKAFSRSLPLLTELIRSLESGRNSREAMVGVRPTVETQVRPL